MPSLASSQNRVSGRPLTSSMTKKGRPIRRQAAVENAGDVGMVHQGQGLPLLLEALQHGLGVHAGLDELQRDLAFDRLGLLGDPDLAHAAFADLLHQRVAAGDDRAGRGVRAVVRGAGEGRQAHPRAEACGSPWRRGPVATGGRSSRLPDFSWAASSASTAARSSGRPAHAWSRKAARSSAGRANASWNRVSSLMAVPRAGTVRVCTPCDEKASPASPIFRLFSFVSAAFHVAADPGPGVNPVAVGGFGRDAEDLGRLIAGQPREVTQFDQPGLDGIALGKPGKAASRASKSSSGTGAATRSG